MSRCKRDEFSDERRILFFGIEATYNVPKHKDRLLARFLQLLEKQQRLLVITKTPLYENEGDSVTGTLHPDRPRTHRYFRNK